eukprot:3393513-Rhodomonas_salina.2
MVGLPISLHCVLRRVPHAALCAALADFHAYDLDTKEWTDLTSKVFGTRPPSMGFYPGVTACEDRLYVLSGKCYPSTSGLLRRGQEK